MKRFRAAIIALVAGSFLAPLQAFAHCPLCTVGAGIAATAAVWLGVEIAPVGVLMGAFGFALGLWIGKVIKKEYVPHQKLVLGIVSFLTTILPLRVMFEDYGSIYISLYGDYGTFLNRTYLIDMFFWGSVLGAVLVALAPLLSRGITKLRDGKRLPFQSMGLMFAFLFIAVLVLQFWP